MFYKYILFLLSFYLSKSSKITRDLNIIKKYENILINNLKYEKIYYSPPEKEFYKYDLKIKNIDSITKYKIIIDDDAFLTRNIAIEYSYYNKIAGIFKTDADIYSYFVTKKYNNYDLYNIPVQILKDDIFLNRYHRTISYNKSMYYIFPIHFYNEYKVIL